MKPRPWWWWINPWRYISTVDAEYRLAIDSAYRVARRFEYPANFTESLKADSAYRITAGQCRDCGKLYVKSLVVVDSHPQRPATEYDIHDVRDKVVDPYPNSMEVVHDGFGDNFVKCGKDCSGHFSRPGEFQCNRDGAKCPNKEGSSDGKEA